MKSIYLRITLLSDAVFTMSSASLGSPRSLDYVPGSVLLGALAGHGGYARARRAGLAWDLFHSGRVRFGNALPLDETGRPTIPVPLSLHVGKGVDRTDDDNGLCFLSPHVRNHACGGRDPRAAYVPLRDGFIGDQLELVRPRHHGSMRTAIGEGGRAREGLLFHIDAIAEGTAFGARVDVDDGLDAAAAFIKDAFGDAVLHLGRSRSAEFGRVQVRIAEGEVSENGLLRSVPVHPDGLVLLALSDVALRSPETLMPTHIPTASALQLPGDCQWQPERSFLRFRSWSPYNGKRQRFDLERQVIIAGSVLVFTPGGTLDAVGLERLAAELERGVGDYRQDGLGQVALNPALLANETLPEVIGERGGAKLRKRVAMPDDDLGQWLGATRDDRMASEQAFQVADAWARRLKEWPKLASSQWRALARVAASHRSTQELLTALFADDAGFTRSGVAQTHGRWGVTMPGRSIPLWKELHDLIACEEHDTVVLVDAIRQLAERQVRAGREISR